jgi:hypothetical protein
MTHHPAQTEPQTAICAGCGRSASTILSARGGASYPLRAVATCGPCEPAHTKWVRAAGTVQRRTLTSAQEELQTLF